MKTTGYITSIFICLALIFSSCSEEDFNLNTSNDSMLTVTVEDNGFITGEPLHTKTYTEGLQTTFTNGDVIGIFTVVNGEISQNNVSMIYVDDVKGWVGSLKKETSPDAQYYAYYPWQQNLNGNVDPSATSSDDFFKDITEKWILTSDQNTYHKYTACDLMTGTGEINDQNILRFSLTHKMGLVLINMPVTKYTFSNTSIQIPDYIIPASGSTFEDFKPCMLNDGLYRYLVRPEEATVISGSYIKNGIKHKFTTSLSLTSGRYKMYNIDGGTAEEKNHLLQEGDYFMKDGSLLAKGTLLTEEQKQNCLGIVFWVGDPTLNDPILKEEHPNCTHGLICALKDGNNTKWQSSYETYNQTVQHWIAENSSGFRSIISGGGPDDNMNQIMGYNNTRAMELFNYNPENSMYSLDIINELYTFRNTYKVPDFITPWYAPSMKELFIMMNSDVPDIYNEFFPDGKNLSLLNGIFGEMGSTYADMFNSKSGSMGKYYYSCSEHNLDKVWCIGSENYYTFVSEADKGNIYHTRFIVAF